MGVFTINEADLDVFVDWIITLDSALIFYWENGNVWGVGG